MNILFHLFPVYQLRVTGKSMEPTLHDGQIVLLNKLAYFFSLPKEKDIVALRDPRDKKILIKRIIKKEKNKFFVQGDNKAESTDSRKFGMIGKNDILGKVF